MLLLRCIFLWPHGITHETSLHVIYCSALNLRKFIKCLIFMPLAWKVRWGHLVIRLFVSPFVCFFSSPEPKARVSYCHSAPSVVRSSVRRPSVNFSHFRLLLQNRLMDFDETWYAWSTHGPLQVLLFFGQIRPGADPGRGQNRSRGVPFFKKLLLQTGRLQRQTKCIAMI